MNHPTQQPSDPYQSFLVKASAGSGKTYQLSDRFVKLVAARAEPRAILTLTFTLKAAAEMKTRILAKAHSLLHDPQYAAEFDHQMELCYQQVVLNQAKTAPSQKPHQDLPQPLSARQTALKILTARRDLAIKTIDSLFYEWKEQYSTAQEQVTAPLSLLTHQLQIASHHDIDEMQSLAWESFFAWPWQRNHAVDLGLDDQAASTVLLNLARGDWYRLARLKNLVRSLTQHSIKITREQLQAPSTNPQKFHPFHLLDQLSEQAHQQWVSTVQPTSQNPQQIIQAFVSKFRLKFKQLIDQAKKSQQFADLMVTLENMEECGDIADTSLAQQLTSWLHQACGDRFFTHQGRVSKNSITTGLRTKNDLHALVDEIEALVTVFCNHSLYQQMRSSYQDLFVIYQHLDRRFSVLKQQRGVCTYDDNAIFAHKLICSAAASPQRPKIMARIHHLLIDELQDTSLIQWDIFHNIATQLLSLTPTLPATVFMVGDPKQSLYTFREAVPYVVDAADQLMKTYGHSRVELSYNYRSHQSICDYVAQVFTHHSLKDFQPAQAKRTIGHGPTNLSAVCALSVLDIKPSPDPIDDLNTSALKSRASVKPKLAQRLQDEAQVLADYLSRVLERAHEYPIDDDGELRPLQPTDIAILYRSATHASRFESALRERGIDTARAESSGVFDRMELKDCMHLLRLCVYPAELVSLMAVASSPIVNLEDSLMMEFLETVDSHQPADYPSHHCGSLALNWHHHFRHHAAMKWIGDFIYSAHQGSFAHRFCALMIELAVAQKYAQFYEQLDQPVEAKLAVSHVHQFMDLVTASPTDSCEEGAEIYARMSKLKGEQFAAVESKPNAVMLMTIHKAKGLEFGMVCLTQSSVPWSRDQKDDFFTIPVSPTEPFSTYLVPKAPIFKEQLIFKNRSTVFEQFKQRHAETLHDESLRMLYVALTRASQYLIISGPEAMVSTSSTDESQSQPQPLSPTFWPSLHQSVISLRTYPTNSDLNVDDNTQNGGGENDNDDNDSTDHVAHSTNHTSIQDISFIFKHQDQRMAYHSIDFVSTELENYRNNSLKNDTPPPTPPPEQSSDMSSDSTNSPVNGSAELSLCKETMQGLVHSMEPHLREAAFRSTLNSSSMMWDEDDEDNDDVDSAVVMNTGTQTHSYSHYNKPDDQWLHRRTKADKIKRLRLFRGNYIHKSLELSLKHRRWTPVGIEDIPTEMGDELDLQLIQQVEAEAKRSFATIIARIGDFEYWSEVWLCGGHSHQQLIQGKADLVVNFDATVEIIDFKTKMSSSIKEEEAYAHATSAAESQSYPLESYMIDPSYVNQLAIYRSCLQDKFDKPITCSIFLTHTQRWVPVEFL